MAYLILDANSVCLVSAYTCSIVWDNPPQQEQLLSNTVHTKFPIYAFYVTVKNLVPLGMVGLWSPINTEQ